MYGSVCVFCSSRCDQNQHATTQGGSVRGVAGPGRGEGLYITIMNSARQASWSGAASCQVLLALTMSVLDYKEQKLYVNQQEVTALTMVGLLVEAVFRLSRSRRVGVSGIASWDLPLCLPVTLDRRGERRVRTYEADRSTAVAVGKEVRAKLHHLGLEMVAACQQVRGSHGKVGEHDLVMEVVADEDGNVPDARMPAGLLSVEVNCRRLWSESGRKQVRLALRKECDLECEWWQHELATGRYVGRVIVVAIFGRSGADFATHADVRLLGQEYRGLWGWAGSRGSLSQPAALATVPKAGAARKTKAMPKEKAQAAPRKAAVSRARPWGEVNSGLTYRSVLHQRVAPVAKVLELLGKETTHVSRIVSEGKRRYSWPDTQVFKAARIGGKRGGSEEWVATASVLRAMYDIVL